MSLSVSNSRPDPTTTAAGGPADLPVGTYIGAGTSLAVGLAGSLLKGTDPGTAPEQLRLHHAELNYQHPVVARSAQQSSMALAEVRDASSALVSAELTSGMRQKAGGAALALAGLGLIATAVGTGLSMNARDGDAPRPAP